MRISSMSGGGGYNADLHQLQQAKQLYQELDETKEFEEMHYYKVFVEFKIRPFLFLNFDQ